MKGLYSRLFFAFAVLLTILLTGLGIVLGQFFPLFADSTDVAIQRNFVFYLVAVLVVTFIISLFMVTQLLSHYAKPIDDVTMKAIKISRGEFAKRLSINEPSHNNNNLSIAIDKIETTMQEMATLRKMEKERLNTLIESMGSGLLMFGRGGSVNLVNEVFRKTFGFENKEIIGETIKTIGLPKEIELLIEEVFMTEQSHHTQVKIEGKDATSSVNVYGAPVIGDYGNWLGIVVVIHDITELVRLEEVRKDFVANVSHELRTPVTSIKGFTETLLDGAMDERAVMKEFLEIIHKESNRLQLLIEELLVLSDVEREGFTLQYSSVNLKKLIEDALRLVSGHIERKKMSVNFDMPSEIVFDGDESRLIQVMVNLLSNAIAYSKPEKEIKISAERIVDNIIITIIDEGIGIEKEELGRLFERFYRVDRARSRDSGGTGLGLAIVKHLIEAHGGFVTVESTPNVGTAVRISIPACRV